MKLKKSIIDAINNPQARTRIAVALKTGEANISLHLRNNKANSRLTKMDALMVIAAEAGCEVSEVLENS